jgi:F-type H+-transporting ATPase subunit delta
MPARAPGRVRPFAQAAFRSALGAGALGEWSAALAVLREALAMPELAAVIADPRVDAGSLAARLGDALTGVLPGGVVRLAVLLAQRGLLAQLDELTEQFEALRRAHEARVKVIVEAARPLSGEQVAQLRGAAMHALRADVDIETRTDPGLIGGAVLRIGDRVIDGSVRGRLEQLAATLRA